LISHPGGDDLKIGDFGLSRKIYFTKLASLNYGMPEFVAPETANGNGVHMATDMWSVGVITYLLLTGVSLFRGKHDRDTLVKVREGKWDDLHLISRNCSDECRDFIKSLLMYQMDNRMDVHTALKHPWLLRADKMPQDEPRLSTDALRHYYQGLRYAILQLINDLTNLFIVKGLVLQCLLPHLVPPQAS
jgi:serine/threonine protein kinase